MSSTRFPSQCCVCVGRCCNTNNHQPLCCFASDRNAMRYRRQLQSPQPACAAAATGGCQVPSCTAARWLAFVGWLCRVLTLYCRSRTPAPVMDRSWDFSAAAKRRTRARPDNDQTRVRHDSARGSSPDISKWRKVSMVPHTPGRKSIFRERVGAVSWPATSTCPLLLLVSRKRRLPYPACGSVRRTRSAISKYQSRCFPRNAK